MLPGRSEDKMFENEALLPPQVMALKSSSFISDRGFNGLLNNKACILFLKKSRFTNNF